MKKELVVIGAGPGGYAAAFAAADKEIQTTLIDEDAVLGGVCLNRGCIPTKALIHVAQILRDAKEAESLGVTFSDPKIDIEKIRAFKEGVVSKLTGGLTQLVKQRKIEFIQGKASFLSSNSLTVVKSDGAHEEIEFEKAILATGSSPIALPFGPASGKIWNSTSALDVPCIPKKFLVIGGGYIGVEFATFFQSVGSDVTIVEMTPSLLPGADRDMSMLLLKQLKALVTDIKLNTKVTAIQETDQGLSVSFENTKNETATETFDRILVSIGRKNVFDGLGLENTQIRKTDDGHFLKTSLQCQTTDLNIYAIGDITGQPMLAHKATAEAKVAIEAIAGEKTAFEPKAIPAVVYTDPELAYCGLTETEAKEKNLDVRISKFPWAASGRAATLGRSDGFTKIIADAKTNRILGMTIAGPGAGEMIAESALAVEMGALARDLVLTVHPHPTLSETIMEAAEGIFGSPTHIYKRK